jgi:hypothetical protein
MTRIPILLIHPFHLLAQLWVDLDMLTPAGRAQGSRVHLNESHGLPFSKASLVLVSSCKLHQKAGRQEVHCPSKWSLLCMLLGHGIPEMVGLFVFCLSFSLSLSLSPPSLSSPPLPSSPFLSSSFLLSLSSPWILNSGP